MATKDNFPFNDENMVHQSSMLQDSIDDLQSSIIDIKTVAQSFKPLLNNHIKSLHKQPHTHARSEMMSSAKRAKKDLKKALRRIKAVSRQIKNHAKKIRRKSRKKRRNQRHALKKMKKIKSKLSNWGCRMKKKLHQSGIPTLAKKLKKIILVKESASKNGMKGFFKRIKKKLVGAGSRKSAKQTEKLTLAIQHEKEAKHQLQAVSEDVARYAKALHAMETEHAQAQARADAAKEALQNSKTERL